MINVEQRQAEDWVLTEEGSDIVDKGSHEFHVFKSVPPEGILQSEIKVKSCTTYEREPNVLIVIYEYFDRLNIMS